MENALEVALYMGNYKALKDMEKRNGREPSPELSSILSDYKDRLSGIDSLSGIGDLDDIFKI